jgi:sulfur-oxidizing protein SoxY
MNRRQILKLMAAFAALPALAQRAFAAARPAAFEKKKLGEALESYFGKNAYAAGDIKFKTPEIAENGSVVPVTVQYDGEAQKIAVLVEKNAQPLAAAFELTSKSAADVSTRIKMGESSIVHAVVQTADGKLLGVANEVKVTIGGCGG